MNALSLGYLSVENQICYTQSMIVVCQAQLLHFAVVAIEELNVISQRLQHPQSVHVFLEKNILIMETAFTSCYFISL